jgi:two-component system cell cycle response regulator
MRMTKPTILTVDDSRIQRLAIIEAFRPYDCVIVQATNGEEGLLAVHEQRPDLILLDYNMPVLDGLGMLIRLRADPELKRTPVIMLTANAAPATIAAVARLGVRDYITKPFDNDALIAKIARLITLRAKTDANTTAL